MSMQKKRLRFMGKKQKLNDGSSSSNNNNQEGRMLKLQESLHTHQNTHTNGSDIHDFSEISHVKVIVNEKEHRKGIELSMDTNSYVDIHREKFLNNIVDQTEHTISLSKIYV